VTEMMNRAPAKALTKSEQSNLEALIRNDYARARLALNTAYREHDEALVAEADELFPDAELDRVRLALRTRFETLDALWQEFLEEQRTDKIGIGVEREDDTRLYNGLTMPNAQVYYREKDAWLQGRRDEAKKAYDKAHEDLNAAELEAKRTVLVKGIGSQEALDVLNAIPPAASLFTASIEEPKELES